MKILILNSKGNDFKSDNIISERKRSKDPNELCIRISDILVDEGGRIFNKGRFIYFISNYRDNVPDNVRVISLTIEGDPIITDVKYDGKNIFVTRDYTYDQWAVHEQIYHYYGTEIFKRETTELIWYELIDENDDEVVTELLRYKKNL